MQSRKNSEPEINFTGQSLAVFVQYYNKNIPTNYPRASVEALETFKANNTDLFKGGDEWTIDKHRKRLMDWLISRRALE
ncbi:MAG: hypothetical protein KBD50_03790 [Candidatus Pacebacteria bacterium]|nr:hypothetical protein [Candidatus Paceibacterota bacterium]